MTGNSADVHIDVVLALRVRLVGVNKAQGACIWRDRGVRQVAKNKEKVRTEHVTTDRHEL